MLSGSEIKKEFPNRNIMNSNKSKVTLTLLAVVLVLFALSECRKNKDATESTPAAVKEITPSVTKVTPEPVVAGKPDAPAPAVNTSPAPTSAKPIPAPGLPPEHRPIF